MALNIEYRLTDPNFTIYHRAALGGLAATITAWSDKQPDGITAKAEHDRVILQSSEDISEKEAVKRILEASFRLTDDKLIDLPGQFIDENSLDLKVAVHEGLCLTFLQHNKMRPGKEVKKIELKGADDESGDFLSYKTIDVYAHQKAQKTDLLEKKQPNDAIPPTAMIRQFAVPGAVALLEAKSEEVLLLSFLAIACPTFLLRPKVYQPDIAQACIVVPDVTDLKKFTRAMRSVMGENSKMKRFSHRYLERVVGGAEEAALRFMIAISADNVASERGISGCQAVVMGKVPWDVNQKNRSMTVRVSGDYPEMDIFLAAHQYLSSGKFIKNKKGDTFAINTSAIPELIAANLAAERHWCSQFKILVQTKEDFKRMNFSREGLVKMKEAIKDLEDRAIIQAFHKAWEMTMAKLGERAQDQGLDFGRLVEVRQEKIRNEILRAKTPDTLAGWFLRFCADASSGAAIKPFQEEMERLRRFMFNPRNFDRFQNLLLFALVSYSSDKKNNN
ncbi:type I-MYXAN CRISPR-associated Cas8a1/Cmx1 [Thermosynechococcaceae cyanobacterium BACA0444]|uniref:Type I-MYXAN CRISPR-associated Cas8a1/Cmx1 n=1 Tax=Pseudocalidococcus azoricus BACA0444 TaxID=2918990 RepID=A0AAE4FRU3_9CYAN|nr:type I-MYXAN CRISPR-associated Cas8a1/Cmx1 [Pseudocalidococcus azoricus]MDS3860588.1 type I-MYXAN CRISPR-associated Cas8a1/Cmx1 [Pseudocalidococcus azoricus BACA0444]